jgi:hypothetical protein
MSLLPADGLYRRRLFLSGRCASRRAIAIRLALAAAGACVSIWSVAVM